MRPAHTGRILIAMIAPFLITSCDDPTSNATDPPTLNVQSTGPLPRFPELRAYLPPVDLGPRTPRAYDVDDDALIAAVAEADGQAFVGFKPAGAARTIKTGVVPGIHRETALAGQRVLEDLGGEITRTFSNIATVVANIPPELGPELRKHPLINYVEPAPTNAYTSAMMPNRLTENGRASWAALVRHEYPPQDTSWGVFKVHADVVWQSSSGNRGHSALIMVFDTGMDRDHLLFSTGDANFNISNCLSSAGDGDCYHPTDDADGHGSHVLGIAGAYNNAYGYIGVAPLADLALIRIVLKERDGEGRLVYQAGSLEGAINWAIDNAHPRRIINMSVRVAHNTTLEALLQTFYNDGGLAIASASNYPRPGINIRQDSVTHPARYNSVIAVSGTLQDDTFADSTFSCNQIINPDGEVGSVRGSQVELSAPFTATSMWSHLRYEHTCGTSMAAPVVAAVAAMVWTKWPTWSNQQVRDRLTSTAVDLPPSGRDEWFGYGRVDAAQALGIPIPVPFNSVSIDGPDVVPPGAWCEWFADPNGGTPPYSYSWSGVLTGNQSSVSGMLFSSGRLDLAVTDSQSQVRYAQKYITVDWSAPPGGCMF